MWTWKLWVKNSETFESSVLGWAGVTVISRSVWEILTDTDCILTFSLDLFVSTLRCFCHLRSTWYDMIWCEGQVKASLRCAARCYWTPGLGQRSFAVAGPKAWNSCCGLPLGVVWRRSCSLELMAFLLTLSSRVSLRGLDGAVRPFGRHLGWRCCTAS